MEHLACKKRVHGPSGKGSVSQDLMTPAVTATMSRGGAPPHVLRNRELEAEGAENVQDDVHAANTEGKKAAEGRV
jgi:hypothetical protein